MTVANFKYKRNSFICDLQKIKSLFTDSNNQDYLLKNINYNENVPIESLEKYFSQIWVKINEKKDIFLPSEKKLLSFNFFQELQKKKLEEFSQNVTEVEILLKKGFQATFINRLDDSFTRIQESFKKEGWKNDPEIYHQTLKELEALMISKIREISNNEIKKVCIMAQRDFQNKSEELFQLKKGVNLYSDLKNLLERIRAALESRVKQCSYEIIYKQPINDTMDVLESLFKGFIAQALEKFLREQENLLLRKFNSDFKARYEELEKAVVVRDFWEHVSNDVKVRIEDFQVEFINALQQNYRVTKFYKIEEIIRNVFAEFKEHCKGFMAAKANVFVLERLKELIRGEEMKMDERMLNQVYQNALGQIDDLLKVFQNGEFVIKWSGVEGRLLEIRENIIVFKEEKEMMERKKDIEKELAHEREIILNKIVKSDCFLKW